MKKTHAAVTGKGSALSCYQNVVVGSHSIPYLLFFEWCQFLSIVPGAAGFFLRKIFWPRLFASCGRGTNFGSNIIVRHPGRIHLGNNVVLSEGCILDGRSEDNAKAIVLDDDVILSNDVMLSCKNGAIFIGARTGINARSIIQSTNNCPVHIGADVIVGQMSFVVGGGSYNTDRLDVPIREQGIRNDGGVVLENDVWLGANVSVLGGVTVGHGSIVAAGAVVTKTVPSRSVCRGVPAKIIGTRGKERE
mgnify:CR=1 FL=1